MSDIEFVSSMSPIQRCPVCDGCGTVPCDFYTRLGVATDTKRERCRTCLGGGVIFTATGQPVRSAPPSAVSGFDGFAAGQG